MGKKITFIYHPTKGEELDEEKLREAQLKIAAFLVKKALEKATFK